MGGLDGLNWLLHFGVDVSKAEVKRLILNEQTTVCTSNFVV